MKNGQKVDLWLRCTVCYRKIKGEWRIAHLQVSLPVDLRTGKAIVDLQP
jgi:ketosteroid isomerase-like protein